MSVRLIATSDNHLRRSQYSTTQRGDDFTKAFEQIIDIAINTKVAAVMQTGDLLDSKSPASRALVVLAKAHHRLRKAGIPMIIVEGDHDQEEPHWVDAMKAYGIEETPSDGGLIILHDQLYTIPGTKLTVYGQSFIGKTKERFLEIKDTLPQADILMWHTMCKDFAGFLADQAVSIAELPTDKYRLIALGDLHVCDYKRAGDCLVGYPGSSELVKKDEPLMKTISLFDIPDSGPIPEPKLLPLLTRLVKVYRLLKEEDVVRVLTELEACADQHPIILGRYDSRIPDVVKRIYAKVDADKCIVRLQPLPEIELPNCDVSTPIPERTMVSFLPEFIQPGSELFEVATALLNPEAAVITILTEFVDKRLAAMGEPSPL